MFRGFSILLFLLLVVVGAFFLRPAAPEEYARFLQGIETNSKKATKASSTSKQERVNVTKEFWMMKDEERLHSKLKSPFSNIILLRTEGSIEVQEKMHGLEGMFQEKLERNPDQQLLRFVKAAEGEYSFKTNVLQLDHPLLSRYLLPGHKLPESLEGEKPLMTSVADSAQVSFNKKIQMTAQQLRVLFFENDRLQE